MPIQIVHTGERIPLEELLASHRDPLVLEYIGQLRSAGFAEKTLHAKRTIIAARRIWRLSLEVTGQGVIQGGVMPGASFSGSSPSSIRMPSGPIHSNLWRTPVEPDSSPGTRISWSTNGA